MFYEDCDDFEGFDEFGDLDATSCANGDYNAFEEEQIFQDREDFDDRDEPEYPYPEFDDQMTYLDDY